MSRFQSWIVLIFIINICFIVGTEESSRPGRRAWLDLNLNPEDLEEPAAETIFDERNVGISAQIPEGGSSSSYDKTWQYNIEKLFCETEDTWHELRDDTNMTNGKWKIICDEMVKEWEKNKEPLHDLECIPKAYINRKWRRMKYGVFVREKNVRGGSAPDFLLCDCDYQQPDVDNHNILANKSAHFGVRHYESNDYFLLENLITSTNQRYHMVRNIHTLNIPFPAV